MRNIYPKVELSCRVDAKVDGLILSVTEVRLVDVLLVDWSFVVEGLLFSFSHCSPKEFFRQEMKSSVLTNSIATQRETIKGKVPEKITGEFQQGCFEVACTGPQL